MTKDPLLITYLQIGGLGFVAALLVVILCALIFRGSAGGGGGLAAARDFLIGKKTYILAGAVVLVDGLKEFGFMTEASANKVTTYLIVGVFVTFRAAVARLGADDPPPAPAPAVPATLTPTIPWPPTVPR